MSTAPTRRLILIRHAKAEPPTPGQADDDRPLTQRGLLDAAAGGHELARTAVPEVVFCSPTRRTRQTWRAVLDGLNSQLRSNGNPEPAHPDVRYMHTLYQAGTFDVVEAVRKAPQEAAVVVVVGHEPTMSEVTLALAGAGSEPEALQQVRSGYPTAGIAVLAVEQEWTGLAPGDGRLEQFTIPRAGGGGSIG